MASAEVEYLTIADLQRRFKCGRSKASNLMYQLPHITVGRRPMVALLDLEDYIDSHGGVIEVRWPRRR